MTDLLTDIAIAGAWVGCLVGMFAFAMWSLYGDDDDNDGSGGTPAAS